MDVSEGKLLYSEILRLARQKSIAKGSPKNMIPGTMREAAEEVWKNRGMPGTFEVWWNAIHKFGLTSKPDKHDTEGPKTLRDMYFQMATTQQFLPSDDVLRIAWKCGNNTISKIRSELKIDNGAVFERIESGYKVVTPPQDVKVQPIPKPAPSFSNGNGGNGQLPLVGTEGASDKALLVVMERIDKRLERIEELMGPMYGTMKKLADAWCAGV